MRAREPGFTLIEVLIAVALMTFLVLVVTQSLLPVFASTREARLQVSINQQAQSVIEAIRAAWQDPVNFRRTCAPITLPSHAEVTVEGIDASGRPFPLTFHTDCASATETPATAKRVTVVIKDAQGQKRISLTLDIPEP